MEKQEQEQEQEQGQIIRREQEKEQKEKVDPATAPRPPKPMQRGDRGKDNPHHGTIPHAEGGSVSTGDKQATSPHVVGRTIAKETHDPTAYAAPGVTRARAGWEGISKK